MHTTTPLLWEIDSKQNQQNPFQIELENGNFANDFIIVIRIFAAMMHPE